MSRNTRRPSNIPRRESPRVKIVAEMPEDDEMQKKLQQRKENDGFPDSCGV